MYLHHLCLFSSLFFFFIIFPLSLCDDPYTECEKQFECGGFKTGYPFWGKDRRPNYCGHPDLELHCENDDTPTIEINSQKFRVLEIHNKTLIMKMFPIEFLNGICPQEFVNTTSLDSSLFYFNTDIVNMTLLYGCPSPPVVVFNHFICPIKDISATNSYFYLSEARNDFHDLLNICKKNIIVPILHTNFDPSYITKKMDLSTAIQKGFEVKWLIDDQKCMGCIGGGGRCGFDKGVATCFCPLTKPECLKPSHQSPPAPSSKAIMPPPEYKKSKSIGGVIGIVIGAGATGIIALLLLIFLIRRQRTKKLSSSSSSMITKNLSSDPSSKSDLETGSMYLGVHMFTHSELEEATDNFNPSNELGDGGFGAVYLGKLRDGRTVAVKRLYENNYKRVEQFLNEVKILTHLRHQYLVTLYGCTSRRSRELLLVYEYVPNGTVADHLHGDQAKSSPLSWPIRLNIALETASALSYLHATDVIHRDVKTNNILLDENFHVKVADFGLSRLFPTDVTHVSTAPQGTPGYVDPEYHQCYKLTDKSDVYSFGVVLIELISSLPAVDITRHRHEINLANLAITKIQTQALHELVDPSLGFEDNCEAKRMITFVAELAFRCLQQEKEMRPTMNEALEVLTGIESGDYSVVKVEDDGDLLKNIRPPMSPDSVTNKWVSGSTTTTQSFSSQAPLLG